MSEYEQIKLEANRKYIKDLVFPEDADNNSRIPNVFPVPTTVINWRTNYEHTVATSGNNVVVLDPFSQFPLKYFNPATETTVSEWLPMNPVSPVIGSDKFEVVRIVSACMIWTDLGSADSRAGRMVTSGLLRSAVKNNRVSLDLLED